MNRTTILLEEILDAPPDVVWRALSEPELVARWLGPNTMRAVVGDRFTVRPGGPAGDAPVSCEILELKPNERLAYRWRAGAPDAPDALDTIVSWIIEPAPGGGTRLRLIHDGFPIVVEQPRSGAEVVDLVRRRPSAAGARCCVRSLPWAA